MRRPKDRDRATLGKISSLADTVARKALSGREPTVEIPTRARERMNHSVAGAIGPDPKDGTMVVYVASLRGHAVKRRADLEQRAVGIKAVSSAGPSSSVPAVVTTVMSIPRTRSVLSWSISWNTYCSVRPKV